MEAVPASTPLPELESGPDPTPVSEPELVPEPEPALVPTSWLEWVAALAEGGEESLDVDTADAWEPAWVSDVELAAAIDELPDLADDNLLSGVAALLESDEPEHAASRTATALISRYLLSRAFRSSGLGGIVWLAADRCA